MVEILNYVENIQLLKQTIKPREVQEYPPRQCVGHKEVLGDNVDNKGCMCIQHYCLETNLKCLIMILLFIVLDLERWRMRIGIGITTKVKQK